MLWRILTSFCQNYDLFSFSPICDLTTRRQSNQPICVYSTMVRLLVVASVLDWRPHLINVDVSDDQYRDDILVEVELFDLRMKFLYRTDHLTFATCSTPSSAWKPLPSFIPLLAKCYRARADIYYELRSGECRRIHSITRVHQEDTRGNNFFIMPLGFGLASTRQQLTSQASMSNFLRMTLTLPYELTPDGCRNQTLPPRPVE